MKEENVYLNVHIIQNTMRQKDNVFVFEARKIAKDFAVLNLLKYLLMKQTRCS
jgi:hypothetical protein